MKSRSRREPNVALQQADFEVSYCELPDDERYKTLDSISHIYDLALEQGLERSSTLVALGGGAIAALYYSNAIGSC